MFQFRGFPLPKRERHSDLWRDTSFGYPRIEGCVRLPEAYRGLPRPSSASEPSYPPDGVAYRAYLKAQYPIDVRSNLYTAIIVSSTHYALHLGI